MTMQKTTLWLSGTDCLLMEVGEELLVAYAHGWEGYTKLPLPRYFEQIMGQLVKQCPWIGVTGYSTDFLVEEGLINTGTSTIGDQLRLDFAGESSSQVQED